MEQSAGRQHGVLVGRPRGSGGRKYSSHGRLARGPCRLALPDSRPRPARLPLPSPPTGPMATRRVHAASHPRAGLADPHPVYNAASSASPPGPGQRQRHRTGDRRNIIPRPRPDPPRVRPAVTPRRSATASRRGAGGGWRGGSAGNSTPGRSPHCCRSAAAKSAHARKRPRAGGEGQEEEYGEDRRMRAGAGRG
jgi:hypothetical protein